MALTSVQRAIIAAGCLAVTVTLGFLPYSYYGHTGIAATSKDVNGTLYEPVWGDADIDRGLALLPVRYGAEDYVFIQGKELDPGRLALWWGGITLLTTAAVLLAGPKKEPAAVRA